LSELIEEEIDLSSLVNSANQNQQQNIQNATVDHPTREDELKKTFFAKVAYELTESPRRPIWIATFIGAITLTGIIIMIIKRTRQEIEEDLDDSIQE